MSGVLDREHLAIVQTREGVRGPHPSQSYRWLCPCGETGRWTRQYETALTGAIRHDEGAGS